MSFNDFLLQNTIKPAKDGRLQFRPNGLFGRGYIISSDEQLRRLRRVTLAFSYIILLLMPLTAAWMANSGMIRTVTVMSIVGVILLVPYWVWTHLQCRKMAAA